MQVARSRVHAMQQDTSQTRLDLSELDITSLPSSLASSRAEHITTLVASGNNLTTLPLWLPLALPSLTSLSLQENALSSVPPCIASLTNLQFLSLSANSITTLPPFLASLPSLSVLAFNDNPIQDPPPHVVSSGYDAIMEYLAGSAASSPPPNDDDSWVAVESQPMLASLRPNERTAVLSSAARYGALDSGAAHSSSPGSMVDTLLESRSGPRRDAGMADELAWIAAHWRSLVFSFVLGLLVLIAVFAGIILIVHSTKGPTGAPCGGSACFPYSCDQSTQRCWTECSSKHACAPSYTCLSDGSCVPSQGAPCNTTQPDACGPFACLPDTSRCATTCSPAHPATTCAPSAGCTRWNQCLPSRPCSDAGCGTYACDSRGTCLISCASSDQCAGRDVCHQGACRSAPLLSHNGPRYFIAVWSAIFLLTAISIFGLPFSLPLFPTDRTLDSTHADASLIDGDVD